MANENFNVATLPDYVENNRDMILKNFALVGTATRRRITIQTGVKKSAYLNYLEIVPELQSGGTCGFNPAGDVTLSQRTINVATIKTDLEICKKKLLGKWAEYLVRVAATGDASLPFEQFIMDGLVDELNKKIEKLIWMGDTTATTNTDLKWIDGFIKQFQGDASVIDVAIASGTSAYNGILSVYMALPEEVLDRGGEIFVSPAIYRVFLQDMVGLNFFHYAGPQNAAPEEFILPGTDVKVVKTPGLAGSLYIVGTFAKNLVYGTDMENDEEVILMEYQKMSEVHQLKVEWNSGVSYFFPDMVVLGAFAAAPASTIGNNNAALASIAANTADLAGIKTAAEALADADKVFKTKEQA